MSDYGSTPPPPPYGGGSEPGNPYGQPYGSPQQPYGAPPPAYGEQPAQNPYGAPPAFGAQAPQQQPYGAPAPYGAPPAYGAAGPVGPSTPWGQVADLGQRLLARLIDGFFLSVLIFIAYFVIAALFFASASAGGSAVDENGQLTDAGASVIGGSVALFGLMAIVVIPLLSIGYEVFMIATRGATFGKKLMGIKVVRELDGQVPGWSSSFARWGLPIVVNIVSCYVLGWLVYLSPVFDGSGRLQGWHDRAAKTLVVKTR